MSGPRVFQVAPVLSMRLAETASKDGRSFAAGRKARFAPSGGRKGGEPVALAP